MDFEGSRGGPKRSWGKCIGCPVLNICYSIIDDVEAKESALTPEAFKSLQQFYGEEAEHLLEGCDKGPNREGQCGSSYYRTGQSQIEPY